MIKKIIICSFFTVFLALTLLESGTSLSYWHSNESKSAYGNLTESEVCIKNMQERNVPIGRVNESFHEAAQLYEAQLALELKANKANYKLIYVYSDSICSIRDESFRVLDEMSVFLEAYNETSKEVNLSSMNSEYNGILRSFQEERFEETSILIDKAYTRISEIESSQTTLNVFYRNTKNNIRDFFTENWRYIFIISGGILVALVIFWKTIRRINLKVKLQNLEIRKKALNNLIKKIQQQYFDLKNISEMEYTVKLQTFNEMILNLNRQIPELQEEIARLNLRVRSRKVFKKN